MRYELHKSTDSSEKKVVHFSRTNGFNRRRSDFILHVYSKEGTRKMFLKFYRFVGCLEHGLKTILIDELKTSFYQPESSFPKSFLS